MKSSFIVYIVISLLTVSCFHSQDCVDGINKLPMYGGVKKCTEQIEADKIFLAQYTTSKSRKDAVSHLVMRGWQYFDAKKLDTSMMRFNQAWLLDSLNANVYWGFGDLLGMQKKFKESLPLFKKSLKIDSANSKIWEDMAISYGNLFFESRDKFYLDSSIYSTKKAIKIDPHNPKFYGELAADYSYFIQKDSAKKYLKITEQLDPNAISPEVKKLITDQ